MSFLEPKPLAKKQLYCRAMSAEHPAFAGSNLLEFCRSVILSGSLQRSGTKDALTSPLNRGTTRVTRYHLINPPLAHN